MKVTDDKILRIYDFNDLYTIDIVVFCEINIFEIANNSWYSSEQKCVVATELMW